MSSTGRLHALLDELAAEDVSIGSLRDELLELDRARARLDAEVSRRLRAFDRSCEWSVDGSRSAAAFLTTHTRCARVDAHHRVRVARQLDAVEETAAAWAAGVITTRHVEAVARARHAAKADDAFAEFAPALTEVARAGTPEDVARTARQWRDALDAELDRDGSSVTEQEYARRNLDFSRSIGGMGFNTATFEALGAEIVDAALKHAYERGHVQDDPRTPGQQRADALVEICRFYLEHQGSARTSLPHVLVVTDLATLEGLAVGECRLASGHRISPETVRRISCDAVLQDLLVDSGVPLAMGRATRTFTADQFRAMVARDAHCRGPGCSAEPGNCEAHHVNQWKHDGGPTDLDNGILVCRGHCHRMLHEGGWIVRGDPNGELAFYDRDGRHLGTTTPAPRTEPILTRPGRVRQRMHKRIRRRVQALHAA